MTVPVLVIDPLKLRKVRKDMGYTQRELAKAARISTRTVVRLEASGDEPDIDQAASRIDTRLSTINGMSKALGLAGFALLKEIPDVDFAAFRPPSVDLTGQQQRKGVRRKINSSP